MEQLSKDFINNINIFPDEKVENSKQNTEIPKIQIEKTIEAKKPDLRKKKSKNFSIIINEN